MSAADTPLRFHKNLKENVMSYVYPNPSSLEGKPKVDGCQCVALVRHYAKAPATSLWREGEAVLGNKNIVPGTAIATFIKGRWPAMDHGNHAALYVGQTSDTITIIDQYCNNGRSTITRRRLKVMPKNPDGTYHRASDNAAAFSVIK